MPRLNDRPVIRLFRFRPARVEFDQVLRTVMLPDLRRIDGLLDVHVGRHGPDQLGDRIVATVWTDRGAMVAGIGPSLAESTFHTERMSDTTEHHFEVLELDVSLRFDGGAPSTLLRLFHGRVKPGELEAYIAEARAGTLADAESGRGPSALYLAADPPDRFVTLSLWPDWIAIERATGGDVRRPISTKDSSRIVEMDVVHYEVVPDAT
jgi:heme-degrading monooxygenase HmoA